jgi:Tfp pilus assembly protein PilN
MIEINLLPVEMRQSEGTPLPRLMSILGGALAATLGVVLVANYYIVDLPRTRQNIRNMEETKKKKLAEKDEVDKLEAEINKIKTKVSALKNLERSRVRWVRLLDAFSKSIPDGVVVRNLRVDPDAGGAPDVGKKFKLTLTGLTTGEAYVDCTRKLTETWNNLKRDFQTDGDKTPAPTPAAAPAEGSAEYPPGYNKQLGLKFEEPVMVDFRPVPLPQVAFPKPEEARKFRQPASGLDFTITMAFYLPPPIANQ